MKKKKIFKRVWREILPLSIISGVVIFIFYTGHIQSSKYEHTPSNIIQEETKKDITENKTKKVIYKETKKSHKDIIKQLVDDVNKGIAGNGEKRKSYLGDHYDEVQSIIDEQYRNKPIVVASRSGINDTPRSVTGSKAEYQDYAYSLCIDRGWSEDDYQCLINLWQRESGWNPNAHNNSSGAHGIPQSLPASKMASHGDDYYTNGYTQIRWGLDYISNRYGTPTKAWNHFLNNNWY